MAEKSSKTGKKLPFKPTALRRKTADETRDALALFQRAREMEALEERGVKRMRETSTPRSRCKGKKRMERGEERVSQTPSWGGEGVEGDGVGGVFGEVDDGDSFSRGMREQVDDDDSPSTSTPKQVAINDDDSFATSTPTQVVIDDDDSPSPSTPKQIIINDDSSPSSPSKQTTSSPSPLPKQTTSPSPKQSSPSPEFDQYIRLAQQQQDLVCKSSPPLTAHVLITCQIPRAKPIRFKVHVDKPLRHVGAAWLRQQALHGIQLDDDQVVLTWQRKRVYNTCSLLDLGIRLPVGGELDADYKLHFEAWTATQFGELEAQLATPSLGLDASPSSSPEPSASEPLPDRAALRITLCARHAEPVGLSVRPETSVETLLTAYRTRLGIASDVPFSIWFDGEQLEEHVTMAEADIDDLDSLEVHFC